VVDPFGPSRNRRTPRRLAELGALRQPNETVLAALLPEETGYVDLARFSVARNLRAAEVERLLAEAGGAKVGGFGFLTETLAAVRADFTATLKTFHETNTDAIGLPPERLRVASKKRWPPVVFAVLLDYEVAAKTVTVDGALVRLPGHSLKLGAKDEVLWQKIAGDLGRDRFKPPRVRDFAQIYDAPEPNVRRLLRQLAKIGRVVEVAPDQFFLRPVVAEMIGIAHGLGNDFTAAQFRDRLDNGRKLAILILEFFDRHGITIRRGDLRRTVPQKLGQYGPQSGAVAG